MPDQILARRERCWDRGGPVQCVYNRIAGPFPCIYLVYGFKGLNKASTIVILKRYTILHIIRHRQVYKGYKGRKASVLGDVWTTSRRSFGPRPLGARFVPY